MGLIHRDLKPANVLMMDATVPVVGDFGLCYRADKDGDGRKTQTSEADGARKYMPPEWREGRADNPQPTGGYLLVRQDSLLVVMTPSVPMNRNLLGHSPAHCEACLRDGVYNRPSG
jgi:serine/threonine protein kinase